MASQGWKDLDERMPDVSPEEWKAQGEIQKAINEGWEDVKEGWKTFVDGHKVLDDAYCPHYAN